MTYSDYIYELIRIAKISGVRFKLHSFTLPENVSGRCDYKNNIILINEPSVFYALITVAHEIGHWFAFLRNRDKDFDRQKREKLAYLYGWALLCYVKSPITKEEWKNEHTSIF